MPCRAGTRTGETASGVAGNGGWPPKPFLQKMIGQILKAKFYSPVVLARDEHEGVGGGTDFSRELAAWDRPRPVHNVVYAAVKVYSAADPIFAASIGSFAARRGASRCCNRSRYKYTTGVV
jgi:hypothetical protein